MGGNNTYCRKYQQFITNDIILNVDAPDFK